MGYRWSTGSDGVSHIGNREYMVSAHPEVGGKVRVTFTDFIKREIRHTDFDVRFFDRASIMLTMQKSLDAMYPPDVTAYINHYYKNNI